MRWRQRTQNLQSQFSAVRCRREERDSGTTPKNLYFQQSEAGIGRNRPFIEQDEKSSPMLMYQGT